MVNMELLKSTIEESGITMTALAKKAGIPRERIYARLNGVGEFSVTEAEGISSALKLNNAERDLIFFA